MPGRGGSGREWERSTSMSEEGKNMVEDGVITGEVEGPDY